MGSTGLGAQGRHGVDDIKVFGTAPTGSVASPALGQGRRQQIWRARPMSGMMVWRLWGGLDDSTSSGEFIDDVSSRKNFSGKFGLFDGVIENLWGLGFANAMKWFICWGTI
jgi:hypothetical protein